MTESNQLEEGKRRIKSIFVKVIQDRKFPVENLHWIDKDPYRLYFTPRDRKAPESILFFQENVEDCSNPNDKSKHQEVEKKIRGIIDGLISG